VAWALNMRVIPTRAKSKSSSCILSFFELMCLNSELNYNNKKEVSF
jgi:hypothetical protein